MKQYWIPCECGGVYKQLIRCGSDSQFPGRCFYRCPLGAANCKSIWADELFDAEYQKFRRKMIEVPAEEEVKLDDSSDDSSMQNPSNGVPSVDSGFGCLDPPEVVSSSKKKKKRAKFVANSSSSREKGNRDRRPSKSSVANDSVLWDYVHAIAFALSVIMIVICLDMILQD